MTANAQTKIIGYFFVLFKYKYLSISKYYLFETNKTLDIQQRADHHHQVNLQEKVGGASS